MSYPTTIFSKKSRSRLGLSGAVVALILVIIGIAVTLIVGSVVGGVIGGWARKEGLAIDLVQANIVGPPGQRQLCVLVQVKNIGSSTVSNMVAITRPVGISWTTFPPATIEPGQTGTFSGCGSAGTLQRGDIISVSVTGDVLTGGNVGDRRNAPIT